MKLVLTALLALSSLFASPQTASATPVLSVPTVAPAATSVQVVAANDAISPRGQQAFDEIRTCLATRNVLLASFLMDDTGSLNSTDPEVARRGALLSLIESLSEISGREGFSVRANLGMFDGTWREVAGWGDLGANHQTVLTNAANEVIRFPAPGQQTNFEPALRAAQDSINAEAATLDGQACQIIFLFTDGRPDVGPGDDAATAASVSNICTPGGIADDIRQSGTHLIALALFIDENMEGSDVPAAHRVTNEHRNWMQSVAEATGPGGVTCGLPQGAGGVYLAAADGAELERRFAGLGAVVDGANEGSTHLTNEQSPIEIPVDAGVSRLRLIYSAPESTNIPLSLPDGSVIDISTSGINAENAVKWEVRGSGGTNVATLTAANGLPTGLYTIAQAGDSTPVVVVDVFYFWDATLQVSAPNGITLGQAENLVVVQRERLGASDDGSFYHETPITVTVNGQTLSNDQIVSNDDGTHSFNVDLSAPGAAPASVRVVASQTAVTNEHALQLGPIIQVADLAIQLPPSYPTLDPASANVDFGTIQQGQTAVRELQFHGSTEGATSVCIGNADWISTLTDVQLYVTITGADADHCLQVPQNGTVQASVTLASQGAASGTVGGVLPLTLHPYRGDQPQQLTVPMTASLFRPTDTGTVWRIFALALALGIGIPIGIMYLIKAVTSKVPGRPLAGKVIPISVEDGDVTREGRTFDLSLADLRDTVPIGASGAKRLIVDGITLSAQGGASPFGEGYVVVKAPGEVSAGNGIPGTNRAGTTARLPLLVHNQWAVLWRPGDPESVARVLILPDSNASPDELDTIADGIRQNLPDTLARLQQNAQGAAKPARTARSVKNSRRAESSSTESSWTDVGSSSAASADDFDPWS